MPNLQPRLRLNGSHYHRVQSPLLKDAQNFAFAALLGDEQHALLALRQHDLVSAHAGFALWHPVKLHVEAHAPTRAHLACRAGQPRRTHVLNADDCARLHGF